MGTRGGSARRYVAAGALLASGLLLAGCGGGATSSDSTVDAGAAGGQAEVPDSAARGVDPKAGGEGLAGTANRPTVQTRAVIQTGTISLRARDLSRARDEVDGILGRYGGLVSKEESSADRRGRPTYSMLELRVPATAFDETMDALAGVGRVREAHRTTEDVTTEVIDVDTRVATGQASIRRLEGFLRRATSVEDMIRVESEIATRQAALESLEAQQKYLADQTAMSTITVYLDAPPLHAQPEPEPDNGFLAGLSSGWKALRAFLVGAATVLGAILPFAAALTVVGVPMWLLVRAVVRRRTPGVPARVPAGGGSADAS